MPRPVVDITAFRSSISELATKRLTSSLNDIIYYLLYDKKMLIKPLRATKKETSPVKSEFDGKFST
jgi:hypothetical protein